MSEKKGIHFYAWIDPDGKIQLPPSFLDKIEDHADPVGLQVFVYAKLTD